MADWLVEARDGVTLRRDRGPINLIRKLSAARRYNRPHTTVLEGEHDQFGPLLDLPAGAVISRNGSQRCSGIVTDVHPDQDTSTVTVTSDLIHLWGRLCRPVPANDVDAQTAAYDVRSGPAEDVALALIDAHAGPGARVERRVKGLALPASQGRGPTVVATLRFDVLGQVVADLLESAGLAIDIVHDESTGTPRRLVTISEVVDRSAYIRFGPASSGGPGILEAYSYSLSLPTTTQVLAAGGGEGAARLLRQAGDTDAEALWGIRIETFVDQRQTTDTGELDKAIADTLAQGAGPTSATGNVADTPALRYGIDWDVGDKVGRAFDALQLPDIVREATTVVERNGTQQDELTSAVIGSGDAASQAGATQQQIARALRRIGYLERRA